MGVVEEQGRQEEEEEESQSSEVVRWEEYLPKMVITVLLVEADDSTRQIVAAILRNCNYKVHAIADGLEAWEILKQKHNNIDLVLTELDLPSISGFALLALITEHDECKNIPVIMMSSSDSISMAFKCMLKGAADFLLKPVRRNELKNLWLHVWRRISNNASGVQILGGSHFLAEAPFAKREAENCSDDNVLSSHNEVQQHQKRMRLEEEIEEEKSTKFETSGVARDDEVYASTLRQAIDLIGTIDDHHNCTLQQHPRTNNEPDSSDTIQLDLSLRTNGVEKLNNSNASAFSSCRCSSSENLRTLNLVNSFSSDEENKSSVITGLNPVQRHGFASGVKPKNLEEPSCPASPLQSDQGTHCSSLGNPWLDKASNNEEPQSGASGSVCQKKDDTKGARDASYREAALAKFRQKRKDRCYVKKVRYQSRKRLAEQRPRVKGQFVSQVQMNQRALETDNGHEDDGG